MNVSITLLVRSHAHSVSRRMFRLVLFLFSALLCNSWQITQPCVTGNTSSNLLVRSAANGPFLLHPCFYFDCFSPPVKKSVLEVNLLGHSLIAGRRTSNQSTRFPFLLAMSAGVSSWQFFVMALIFGCKSKSWSESPEFEQNAAKCSGV